MIRIFLILIASAASFFGIVFLIETKSPDVKLLSADPNTKATIINPHGLPSEVLGAFLLDQEASKQWLEQQEGLSDIELSQFQEVQSVQKSYNFDGDHLWRDSPDKKVTIQTLEVNPEFVKLQSTISLSGKEIPNEFFLQWDDQGFWLSQYLPGSNDKKKLYRARYKPSGLHPS